MPKNQCENEALLRRIQAFQFDEGGEALTFAQRLARENGWTASYTARVMDEYRRFMYLAVVAEHPVTPSDQVDQVWHLHLTYTRSYWQRWCRDVLRTEVHHGPTKGGREENEKFQDWYGRTLESYEQHFESNAPVDVWPDVARRFGEDLSYKRVNTARNWIVPRPTRRSVSLLAFSTIVLVVGCQSQLDGESIWKFADYFLVVPLFIGIIFFVVRMINKNGNGGGRGGGGSSGGGFGCGGCGGCGH